MPVAYQGVNRLSNAVALLVAGRVLVLRQIANALNDTGLVTGYVLVLYLKRPRAKSLGVESAV